MKRFSKTPVLLIHCGKLRTIITCLLTPNNTISNSIIPSSTIPHIIYFTGDESGFTIWGQDSARGNNILESSTYQIHAQKAVFNNFSCVRSLNTEHPREYINGRVEEIDPERSTSASGDSEELHQHESLKSNSN